MKSLLFVEQFYYPEGWGGAQFPRDVTVHMARAGWRVEVICGSDQYAPVEGDPGPDPARDGVRIRRIPRILGGDIHSAKLLRQLWFYVAAVPLLLLAGRPSVVVTQTNPPLVVLLTAVASLLRRRPYVIVAQDLYPEVVFAHGLMSARSMPGRMLARLFRWAYGRAAAVVSLGACMTQRLIAKGVGLERITMISNWATGGESIVHGPGNRLLQAWGLAGRFVLLYSGNLGIGHDIETPIRAVREAMATDPRITLVFIGKGSRLDEARRLAKELEAEDAVRFFPFVSSEELPHSLGLADVALVTLKKGFEGLVVPSKALGYLARGIPTIYVGPPSDIQGLLDDSGAGVCFHNGDVSGLARALCGFARTQQSLERLSQAGVNYYRRELDRAIGLARYRDLLERTAQE